MTNEQESAMVRAHKAGREYATRLDASRAGANTIAQGLSVAEGDAFLGGYYGELRRLTSTSNERTVRWGNTVNHKYGLND